jgi:hypothetical protein
MERQQNAELLSRLVGLPRIALRSIRATRTFYSPCATRYSPGYAASAFAGFSGAVIAPDALIAAISSAE